MNLLIVESPSKCKTIEGYLGAGWVVKASYGHIRDLPEKVLGVDGAPDFGAHYEVTERGRSTVANLKKLVAGADKVYLATDPDREGEAISWHLLKALGLTKYQRVTFNEITKSGILAGMAAERQLDMPLVAAQEARRVLDRLVGYKVSPEVSRALSGRLSAGRVQSPALKLLVLREQEIRAFAAKKHFGVKALFDGQSGDWSADWDFSPMLEPGAVVQWTDRGFADKVATCRQFQVVSCAESVAESAPPAPYTTSTLQQAASVALGMDPKETMRVAQALFDRGRITYMRTDNPNLSDEAIAKIFEYAKSKGLPTAPAPRKFKSRAGAQEAHEAIRPTDFWNETVEGALDEERLYALIRNRAIASQLAVALYDVRTVALSTGPIDGATMQFKAVGRVLKSKGWRALTDGVAEDEDATDPAANNPVPALTRGQALTATRCDVQEKTTQAKPRYTQASLIKKLEAEGIGRPSTYAAIIDGLLSRGYSSIEKKKMVPTQIGEDVIGLLDGHFRFMDLKFTRDMESMLDDIAGGRSNYKTVVAALHGQLEEELPALRALQARAPADEPPCPKCGKSTLRTIKGPSGLFLGCRGYPECRHTESLPDVPSKSGKSATSKPSAKKPAGARPKAAPAPNAAGPTLKACPACGKAMVLRKGPTSQFWGCSGFPACRNTAKA